MQTKIEMQLEAVFFPCAIEIIDQSELHFSHYTRISSNEPSHLKVKIVSEKFEGMNKAARHRMVYNALKDRLSTSLHALSLVTLTPAEARGQSPASK